MDAKPYLSLNRHYQELFGKKTAKLSLDAGFGCPNRDGTLGTDGCMFCSARGSGDFVFGKTISEQMEAGRRTASKKWKDLAYVAYFQAYTNTYAPVETLRAVYQEAISPPDIVGLSIATRPDCLGPDVLSLLCELQAKTKLWVELGLQTANEESAARMHRGYPNSVFETAVHALHSRGIDVVVHIILGLPQEAPEDTLATIDYLNRLPIQGIKLQLLHVLEDAPLAALYQSGSFSVLTQEAYLTLVCNCIARLRPDIVIHRLTGDGARDRLLAPLWSLQKSSVTNALHKRLRDLKIIQGQEYTENIKH